MSAAGSGAEADPDGRRGRILAAAWELFERLGYKGATVEAIAKAAGIAKGSVYSFFETKDELLNALVEGAGDAMGRSADALIADARGGVADIVRDYVGSVLAYRDQYRVYRALVFEAKALGTPAASEAVARLDRRFEAELARMLRAFEERGVIGPCDCEAASVAVLEAYSGLVAYRDASGQPLSEERIKAVMGSLLCGGLLGAGAS